MPKRLARLERIHVRAPIYFVTACTAQRKALLARKEIHSAFVRFAQQGQKVGAWVGAYVLMPDHFHLLLALEEPLTLSEWMRSLKGVLSAQLRKLGIPAPHWQKGFFDHVLRSGESASEKWDYVRENPVRAGLVARWAEWPFQGEIFPIEYRFERL
jgi:REP element-mobilizing transposase RayT